MNKYIELQPQKQQPTSLTEVWRTIPDFEDYEASNLGRIRSKDRVDSRGRKRKGRVLRPAPNKYFFVQLSKNGTRYPFKVHQLVALTFLGLIPSGLEINHKDMNCKNNRVENLEYVTHQYNVRHGFKGNTTQYKKILAFNVKMLLASDEFTGNEIQYLTGASRSFITSVLSMSNYAWMLPELKLPESLPAKITLTNRKRIYAMFDSGATKVSIAKYYNVYSATIQKIIKERERLGN